MSAPWEVFREEHTNRVDGRKFGAWTNNKPERDGDFVRYLRADLTCGECANHGLLRRVPGFEDDAPCPHECATMKHKYTWPRADGPACMAFAPKEQK